MADKKYKFCPICGRSLILAFYEERDRLICRRCRWGKYDNPFPVALSVVKNKKDEILLIRRGISPGIGKWALPGGFIETGESAERACIRELEEETGIKGKIIRLIGVYPQESKLYGHLLVIAYEIKPISGSFSLSQEIKEAKFVNLRKIPYIPFCSHRSIIKDFLIKRKIKNV